MKSQVANLLALACTLLHSTQPCCCSEQVALDSACMKEHYWVPITTYGHWTGNYTLFPCIRKYSDSFDFVCQPFKNCKNHYLLQFSSVLSLSRVRLCDPMNHSTPGLPVHHQLLEFTQTHVHQVGDAIQPSHPLSSPSPPAPNPSQHQGLFQWVSSLHEVAKVLEFQL